MNSFKLGDYEIEIIGKIEEKRPEYPFCDNLGNPVTRQKGHIIKAVYKNNAGGILDKVYRLIKGKPFDRFKRTREVKRFLEVSKISVSDLIIESFYLCKNEELREKLEKNNKAVRFYYSFGSGYKAYLSYLVSFQENLIMICGWGSLSMRINKLLQGGAEDLEEDLEEDPEKETDEYGFEYDSIEEDELEEAIRETDMNLNEGLDEEPTSQEDKWNEEESKRERLIEKETGYSHQIKERNF